MMYTLCSKRAVRQSPGHWPSQPLQHADPEQGACLVLCKEDMEGADGQATPNPQRELPGLRAHKGPQQALPWLLRVHHASTGRGRWSGKALDNCKAGPLWGDARFSAGNHSRRPTRQSLLVRTQEEAMCTLMRSFVTTSVNTETTGVTGSLVRGPLMLSSKS